MFNKSTQILKAHTISKLKITSVGSDEFSECYLSWDVVYQDINLIGFTPYIS